MAADTAHLELENARWFGDKGRRIAEIEPVDSLGPLRLVDFRFVEGPPRRYALLPEDGGLAPLVEAVAGGRPVRGAHGLFVPEQGRLDLGAWARFPRLDRSFQTDARAKPAHPVGGADKRRLDYDGERPLQADQSNTSAVFGERLLVKCYRRLEPGPHPELELAAALAGFPNVPAYGGSLRYVEDGGDEWALILVQAYAADGVDGYAWAAGLPPAEESELLGRVTAELHAALARALPTGRATQADLAAWREAAERRLEEALRVLEGEAAAEVAGLTPRLRAELDVLLEVVPPSLSRVHGDYHLGNVLRTAAGFAVVDFEGEPTRTLAERRRLESPLRDVASMLRSLDHAAAWGVEKRGADLTHAWSWAAETRSAFLAGYGDHDTAVLRAFEVEKELYEFVYAQRYLPEWISTVLAGLRSLLRT